MNQELPFIFNEINNLRPYCLFIIKAYNDDFVNLDDPCWYLDTFCLYTIEIIHYLCTLLTLYVKPYNGIDYWFEDTSDSLFIIKYKGDEWDHIFSYIRINNIYYKLESSLFQFSQRVTIVNNNIIIDELIGLQDKNIYYDSIDIPSDYQLMLNSSKIRKIQLSRKHQEISKKMIKNKK